MFCTVDSVSVQCFAVFSVLYAICSVQSAVFSVQCAICNCDV